MTHADRATQMAAILANRERANAAAFEKAHAETLKPRKRRKRKAARK